MLLHCWHMVTAEEGHSGRAQESTLDCKCEGRSRIDRKLDLMVPILYLAHECQRLCKWRVVNVCVSMRLSIYSYFYGRRCGVYLLKRHQVRYGSSGSYKSVYVLSLSLSSFPFLHVRR